MSGGEFQWRKRERFILLLWLFVPVFVAGNVKTWTGNGRNGFWSDPQNWSGASLPAAADEVLLDNRDFPGSYQVILPDLAVIVMRLTITPSDGNTIELILPASNKETDALTVSGPGYGICLNTGAVFRNASGISGGESIRVSDSIRINNGARYIHNTKASHANSILRILSSAPGTEKGIFEFDVPKASYTISVSNRIYGSLVLSADTYGSAVNYTCSGSSPLTIRGDLQLGNNVSLSVNLSGPEGNIQVDGDYIQEEGTLNLATGAAGSTILGIRGNLDQAAGAVISATSTADPVIELNGSKVQLVSAAGTLINGVCFRINNPAGCKLQMPLSLPHRLELMLGKITSTAANPLILAAGCSIQADSTRVEGPYVDGPLRKLGLNNEPYFLFPVGKDGAMRWMELKQATGDFTVEYMDENPALLGSGLGSGIDHISKMEYWKVNADGAVPGQASVELSFVSPRSGTVTDPDFLNVSRFSKNEWADAGHTGFTGNAVYGSVISDPVYDFTGQAFTLASTADLENPLPLTIIQFEGKEKNGYAVLNWSLKTAENADHFDLLEATDTLFHLVARIRAIRNQEGYSWKDVQPLKAGKHYYKLNMVDLEGNSYSSKTVLISSSVSSRLMLSWVPAFLNSGCDKLYVRSPAATWLQYNILTMSGKMVKQGKIFIPEGVSDINLPDLESGIYLFYGSDPERRAYVLRFVKN